MEKSKLVAFNLSPQCKLLSGENSITLNLDHLEKQTDSCALNLKELYERQCSKSLPGTKISFTIKNEISKQEQELFKFCKDQMKKKKFELIVAHATELLKDHPSSAWAHFFYGVACKKIPNKENLFVPALTHAVTVNPNFLSGWQALHKHFQSLGGFFCQDAHDEMCIIVKVLLRLEPNYENWCGLVGQIWDYVTVHDFNDNRILKLLSPYLECDCPKRRETVAQVFINFIRYKKKLLTKSYSSEVLKSFQILIVSKDSEVYRLGVLFAAVRYFNRSNDSKQICELLNFVHVNDVLKWNLTSAREFAYNLIYEIFKTLGPDSLETVLILKNACGEEMLNNNRYFLSDVILKLTSSYSNLLENYNTKRGSQLFWGRLLYLKVLTHLKLYQEAYEQVLVDLNLGVQNSIIERDYMEILIDILGHAEDLFLQRFALQLGYKYLKLYGLNVKVLHHICFINVSLNDHKTAAEVFKCLVSLGAIDDVIYLQAFQEEDNDVKLDYLKALENVSNAHLLSAAIYNSLGKSKRVVKSMLEASFHYHGGIAPFEWLGIHYYERDLILKSIRYFLEAFSSYLVSCISVNFIISIYSKHGDTSKLRAFFETLNARSAITMDVACSANLKAGLNYLTKAKETYDFHRALEKFRKVTDFNFERKIIEMVADSQSYFGMHGSASDFYLMCHAENGRFHVYPSVLYGTETKMVKRRGYKYLNITRNVAAKASQSPMALYTYGCAVFDRALASHSVNNYRHCIFLCQQAILILSRCIALYSEVATFWINLGNVMFTVSSVHASFGTVVVPSWLLSQNNESQLMVLVKKHEAYVLALRCYSVALKICKSEDIRKLINFYVGFTFRYAKTFYKDIGDRMLYWALGYALDSCDFLSWQRNNLCGVILTGLNQFKDALEFFKDAMLIGAKEDARDAEFNLGIVYLRLGEFMDAHEVFMYRRGGDPMDSLVWRSYILLHQCLGDRDTVLHYLWYLIYSIKHYPSFEQGMEYLRLICDFLPVSDSDNSDQLKKKCLLWAIFRSQMFMKRTFVGDCEVPLKFNDATALNYFHHGEYQSALGNHTAAEDNFHNFLKLVAEHGRLSNSLIDQSLFRLAMASENNLSSLHDLFSTEKGSPNIALSKFYLEGPTDHKSIATLQLLKDLDTSESESDELCAILFGIMKNCDRSKLSPTTKKLYMEFVSRTLIRILLRIPTTRSRFSHPDPNEEMLDQIVQSAYALFKPDQSSSLFLSKKSIFSILEKELSEFL